MLPAGQSPDFWRDPHKELLSCRSELDIDPRIPCTSDLNSGFGTPFYDVAPYVSAVQPVAEFSVDVIRSFFGLAPPESLGVDKFKVVPNIVSQLEADVPEFSTEEFKREWEMLSCSSY